MYADRVSGDFAGLLRNKEEVGWNTIEAAVLGMDAYLHLPLLPLVCTAMSLQTPAADAIHLPITQPLLSRPRSLQEWQQLLLKSGGAAPRWTDEAAPRQQVPTIQRSGPHLRLLRLQYVPAADALHSRIRRRTCTYTVC